MKVLRLVTAKTPDGKLSRLQVIYATKGLELAQSIEVRYSLRRWYCVHTPTGTLIAPPFQSNVDMTKKSNRMRHFIDYLDNAFPWKDWKQVDKPPFWANEAWRYKNEYKWKGDAK